MSTAKISTTLPLAPAKKKNYLNNKDILAQVMLSKKKGQMTNELALMLLTLCRRYAKKGNFANYSYNEDMQGYAMMMLCKTWNSFDEKKSDNPFAFFTQCIKNSFIQYLNQERRQRDVKNQELINIGLSPSYSYMLDYEMGQHGHKQVDIEDEANIGFNEPEQKTKKLEFDPTEPVSEEAQEQEPEATNAEETTGE